LRFHSPKPGSVDDQTLDLTNLGNDTLHVTSMELSGRHASQFSVFPPPGSTVPPPVAPATTASTRFTLRYTPAIGGSATAILTVHTDDPDPSRNPFIIPLTASCDGLRASRSGAPGSPFTFGPLRVENQTGLVVQSVSFRNAAAIALPHGIKLELRGVAAGVKVFSSSAGQAPGSVEVLYTNPIAVGETISFTLVYSDPLRRTSSAIQPLISAFALDDPVPQPGEMLGTLARLRSVRASSQGPLVEFDVVSGSTYVVEYSDDLKAWHAAVHRLMGSGSRMLWVDRGQPETQSRPAGTPQKPGGRYYRVKRLVASVPQN
jgi:hypothetical protein